jgi:hypothetical protein
MRMVRGSQVRPQAHALQGVGIHLCVHRLAPAIVQERVHSASISLSAATDFVHDVLNELEAAVKRCLLPNGVLNQPVALTDKDEIELGTLLSAASLVKHHYACDQPLQESHIHTSIPTDHSIRNRARCHPSSARTLPHGVSNSTALSSVDQAIPRPQGLVCGHLNTLI